MKARIFRSVTGVAAAYHIILATTGFLCPVDTVVSVVSVAFGVTLEVGPQLSLIVKFASVYMLAFGLMLLLLSSNPFKYRVFVVPALVLFGLRFANRIVFFTTLTSAGMAVSRNVTGTVLILAFFVTILLSTARSSDQDQTHASSPAT